MAPEPDPARAAANTDDDLDQTETAEWREAFLALLRAHGPERARWMLDELARLARRESVKVPVKLPKDNLQRFKALRPRLDVSV